MKSVLSTSRPRIAIGGIMHETHTFMEQPTTMADFIAGSLYRGEEILTTMGGTRSGIGGVIDAAFDSGWQLLPTLYATAMPAGTVDGGAYQALLSDLLYRLRAAMPLDGVLLTLHGAMVAEGERDVEADILAQSRASSADLSRSSCCSICTAISARAWSSWRMCFWPMIPIHILICMRAASKLPRL